MKMNSTVTFLVVCGLTGYCLSAVLTPPPPPPQPPLPLDPLSSPLVSEISPNCLGCICEAGTKCNTTVTCVSPWPEAYWCGPFLISWAYWADGGKQVLPGDNPERKGAFEACVQNVDCAVSTVRSYMTKYAQDCNGDGRIDCDDYIRIHRLGGFGCSAPLDGTEYLNNYQTCKSIVPIL